MHVYVCEPVCVYTCIHVCLCVSGVLVALSPEGTEEDNWSLDMSCKACVALKHQCKYSHKITLSRRKVVFLNSGCIRIPEKQKPNCVHYGTA